MIADCDTTVVFVADTLEPRFHDIYAGLASILKKHGIPLKTIPGTRDIWCRDYMPVQVAVDRFVQFRYAPDYLTGKYRHLRTDGEIGPTLPWVKNCIRSEIVLDGGNVVRWRDKVILTEKIFDENRGWNRRTLVAELERVLEVERVIVIPREPGDVTGHADGVVRFIDGATVIVNDYRRIDRGYRRTLLRELNRVGLEYVNISYRPESNSSEAMPTAVGNFVNFLQVGTLLILPTYNLTEEEEARQTIVQSFPGCYVEVLNCREIASEGGVLNCVSSNILLTKSI